MTQFQLTLPKIYFFLKHRKTTEFAFKCHQHKQSDFLKDTLRVANFDAASEIQFSKFPSILSLTHPVIFYRKQSVLILQLNNNFQDVSGERFLILELESHCQNQTGQ